MRAFLNSMHIVHAVDCGVELGLFETLAQMEPPVTIEAYTNKAELDPHYMSPWLNTMHTAGIVQISDEKHVSFSDDWREALTDPNSSNYLPPMLKCHLAIERTYSQFPSIFRGQSTLAAAEHDKDLLGAIAEDGLRFANFFIQQVVDQIPALRALLTKGINVYDVGCGGGHFLCRLAAEFSASTFVGLDPLPRVIELAREIAKQNNLHKNIQFTKACATSLEAEVADLIILNEVLHEMDPDVRLDALKACRAALKADGILFLVDILAPENELHYKEDDFKLSALVQFFEAPWGSRLLSYGELEKLLQKAGFGTIHKLMPADNVIAAYVKAE